jgi:UDP:flavonoid glycosyltransferase YjiC (YdhE family)
MRVLFSSTSGYGHLIPMLPLARAFREAGHDVLWATAEQAMPLVTAAGVEAVASGASGPEEAALRRELRNSAESVDPAGRGVFVFPRMFGAALTPPMVADLVEIARRWRPDLLVHENAELAAPLVGAACAVPSLTHAFGGAVPAGALAASGERLADLWQAHGLEVPPYAGCFASGYLDICPTSVQNAPMDHIRTVQPLRPVAEPGPRPGATEPPLVYVTMGTVQQRPELLRDVLAGITELPVRVLVALGAEGDPSSLGAQPARVQVESWVDQAAVLDRSSAVVSHGGSGTFLGALARGLPQLCLPQAADQFRNAEGGSRAGASLTLSPEEVTPTSVRAAVARLLSEPDLRSGAERVAAEIAAMPTPEAVVPLLVARFDPHGTHTHH